MPLRACEERPIASTRCQKHGRRAHEEEPGAPPARLRRPLAGKSFELQDGAVLIAAITSCTNTSNPSVLIAAGLLARNARKRGLTSKPWVKTCLAPGSRVVTDYLKAAGLLDDLDALGFHLVGYGCTTCIGNSGPLKPEISDGVKAGDVIGCVGALRQPQLRRPRAPGGEAELPGLAAAGGGLRARRLARHRPEHRAARHRQRRQARVPEGHLADPRRKSPSTVAKLRHLRACSSKSYAGVFDGDERWQRHQGADRQGLRLGRRSPPTCKQPALLRRHDA